MPLYLAATALFAAACASPIHPSMRDPMNTIVVPYEDGIKGTVQYKSRNIELSDDNQRAILTDLINQIAPAEDAERKKLLQSNSSIQSAEETLVAFLRETPDRRILTTLEDALEDMQKSLRIESTDFTFTLPKNKNELTSGNLERQIALIADIFYLQRITIRFDVMSEPVNEESSANASFYFDYTYSIRFDRRSYYLEKISAEPVMITLKGSLAGSLMSLATTIYAHQLTQPTVQHILSSFNSLGRVFDRDLTGKEKAIVDESWRQKQLMASYALAYLWMLDYGQKKLGMDFKDIKMIQYHSDEFNHVRDIAISMGFKEFMRNYAEKPNLIFR